jgi:hypothetical protein
VGRQAVTPKIESKIPKSRKMKKLRSKQKQVFMVIAMAVLIMAANGCSTIHAYQTGGPQGREAGNQPGTEWESQRSNIFFWGAIRQDVKITNCALGNGERLNIEEFKFEKNFGCIVATIFTLGIWEPVKVSWRCAKPINQ